MDTPTLVGILVAGLLGLGGLATGLISLFFSTRAERHLDYYRMRDSLSKLNSQYEIGIYKELWKTTLNTGRAAAKFQSLVMAPPEGINIEELYKDLEANFNELNRVVHDNRPFYSPKVFSTAKEILADMRELGAIVREEGSFKEIDDIVNNLNDKQVIQLAELIRKNVHLPSSIKESK